MKEGPILFNGAMIRAILDGRKTMTRRVAKVYETLPGMISPWGCHCPRKPENHVPYCPYGQPGDRLWVRETWMQPGCKNPFPNPDYPELIVYRADDVAGHIAGPWKPSIFMPRWASRITLEITDVRVERLQGISEADARAEGIEVDECGHVVRHDDEVNWGGAVWEFASLWDSINGKKPGRSWADNPWVWVISFKRIGD